MAELHEEIAQEVTGLQAEITAALQGLESVDEDDPQYAAAFARLVQAGTALLEYEAQVPDRLEQPHLEVSTKSFTVALWDHRCVCGAPLGVAAGVGWISGGWTLLALAQLIGTSVLYTAGNKPLPGKHRQLRHAATALGIASVAVPLLAFGVLAWWVWLLPLVCWAAGYGLASEASGADARRRRRRERIRLPEPGRGTRPPYRRAQAQPGHLRTQHRLRPVQPHVETVRNRGAPGGSRAQHDAALRHP